MGRQKRFAAVVVLTLLIVYMVGGSLVSASEPGLAPLAPDGLVSIQGEVLTNAEMREIDGESWQGAVIVAVGLVIQEAWDYSEAGEWLQETAFPAIESAAVTAYETTKEAVTSLLEMIGEASMENPYMWAW